MDHDDIVRQFRKVGRREPRNLADAIVQAAKAIWPTRGFMTAEHPGFVQKLCEMQTSGTTTTCYDESLHWCNHAAGRLSILVA